MADKKTSEAKRASNRRWDEQNIERLTVAVPIGKKQIIKDYAAAHGEKISGFINLAIDEAMERDRRDSDG
jgi:hypothetical protein